MEDPIQATTIFWDMTTETGSEPPNIVEEVGGGVTRFKYTRVWYVMEFYSYWSSVVPWVALFCNGISFIVFAYKINHSKREQNVNILLAGLAVADTFGVAMYFDYSIYFWNDYGFSPMQGTEAGCRGIQYINSIARDCASYFILIFTIDRFVSVRFPLQKSIWITPKRVKVAMVVTFVCSAIAEIYWPYILRYNERWQYCMNPKPKFLAKCAAAVRNTMGFVVPALAVAVLNGLIIYQLKVYNKKRAAMTGTETHNRALTILLVSLSTFSFLVSLPRVCYAYYAMSPWKQTNDSNTIAAYVCDAMPLLNHTCNFFFYCLSGSQFRRDMLRIFSCGKFGKDRSTATTSATGSTAITNHPTGRSIPMKTISEKTDAANGQSTTSLSTVATVASSSPD